MGNPNTEKKKFKVRQARAKDAVKTKLWTYINLLDLTPLDPGDILVPYCLARQGYVLYWRSYFKIKIDNTGRTWRDPVRRDSETL